eukprot:CAMPEP_0179109018 /NCGR_PEP_ID=MMETSP0796-20121207/50813_1 /TAXON_ID=73915 /ORGANISM="Pyrodinium bahamense, Strain pbaha01" /LENGTH=62 /DNA_ID=CAMNT_0020807115 /DNA_START=362 /DNA_END=550 /DNA_ORIENTATION=-
MALRTMPSISLALCSGVSTSAVLYPDAKCEDGVGTPRPCGVGVASAKWPLEAGDIGACSAMA